MLKRYIVTTPLYDEPVDMVAPGEYVYEPTRDVTVVEARNRSAAKRARGGGNGPCHNDRYAVEWRSL